MRAPAALIVAAVLATCSTTSCNMRKAADANGSAKTLRDYALRAKHSGSREALVPYAIDEQEGEMLVIRSIDEAINSFEWIVGEPIDEKTLTFSRVTNSIAPDSIFTVYRIRLLRRMRRSPTRHALNPLEARAIKEMPVASQDMLVLKSGGNAIVDGVLLKKRGSPCFSELLPRPYLLALNIDASDRIGRLAMGCRSIFLVNGDSLIPRDTTDNSVTRGMKQQFSNSLSAFMRAF